MPTEISNQFDRIETSKENIKQAIVGKGVSVPSTAKIQDLASYIRNIPTGDIDISTCTVVIDLSALHGRANHEGVTCNICYTTFVDGGIHNEEEFRKEWSGTEIVLYNVVAGSVISASASIPIYAWGADVNAPFTELYLGNGATCFVVEEDMTVEFLYASWLDEGGGASVTTCILRFDLASYYNGGDIAIIYTDANGATVEGTLPDGNSAYELTVACNSLFYMSGTDLYFGSTSGFSKLVEYRGKGVYRVTSQTGTHGVTFDNS